jgi:tetratricopeptide (TPR) repeat protein
MSIKDYKGKNSDRTFGLKRGKSAIKREASSLTPGRIVMWVGLFGLVFFINYLFFVHLDPINKKGINRGLIPREHTIPDTTAQWLDKGYKRYQEGKLLQAVEAFSKAITLNPKKTRAYLDRGIVYSTMGMYDKAINDYNTVITLNPDHAEAYNNRGWAYLKKALYDYTIKDCSKALHLNPDMATAYYTRGMAYKAQGSFDMAGKDFRKSCELDNNSGCQAYKELSKKK